MFSKRCAVVLCLMLVGVKDNCWCLDCSTAPRICEKFDSNCEECIRAHPCCSWCLDEDFKSIRCNTEENLVHMKCIEGSIYSSDSSHIHSDGLQNKSFINPIEEKNQPAVQIRPQKMNIQLRLNDPVTFQLQYKAAVDYPLDLYYLMDLTYSMRGDVGTMITLGSETAERLTNLTKSYKIGFGYFMDKVVMPFSENNKKYLEDPCKISGNTCEKGYDFIHALNFTAKISEFVEKVQDFARRIAIFIEQEHRHVRNYLLWRTRYQLIELHVNVFISVLGWKPSRLPSYVHNMNAILLPHVFCQHLLTARTFKLNSSKITGNLDDLEGGLDAIMQIIVCKDQMQWRTFSRKIIVIATDGLLHFAGDGILAGITNKNPGICLIHSDGSYLGALDYDYPSLEEIYRKLLQYKVNLLFAAKSTVFPYYEELEKTMPIVSSVGELEKESQNILKLIEASYLEVLSSAHFEAKAPDEIKVTFHSSCNKNQTIERNYCNNIEIGQEYTFDVTLELVAIPKSTRAKVIIEELNLAENVDINIEYIAVECECPEQRPVHTRCVHGKFKCGKCICDKDWGGYLCDKECSKFPCRFTNATYTSSTCFSRGSCNRDKCECICYPEYIGTYCEYNQCKSNPKTRKICSDHGTCDRGICICDPMYEKDDCSCYKGTEKCTVPGKELCNGVGKCICGECKCPKEHTGERCEYCPSCDKMCEAYDDCIISVAQNKTTHACSANGTLYITQKGKDIEAKCLARYLNDGGTKCEIEYVYFVEASGIKLIYLDPYCPPPFYASIPAISAFVAILLGGIVALIVWRLTATYKDRIAYQKFLAQCNTNTFSRELNPLYKSPVRQYVNPNRNGEEMMAESAFGGN